MDDRGVSEVIGFVLVFSLVLATIGLVYAGGLSSLDDSRDAERINNAERAFDVLADSFETMARGDAPNGATEIKIADAQLSTGNERRVTVTTQEMSATGAASNRSRAMSFDGGTDTRIVYEHGAVIRVDGDASTMQREPDFVFDEERTVIRYIEVVGGRQNIGGDTTVLVRSSVTTSELLHTEDDPDDVALRLNTTTTRAAAWMRYLESEIPDGDCTLDTNGDEATIECTFETESLHVALTQIRIQFT